MDRCAFSTGRFRQYRVWWRGNIEQHVAAVSNRVVVNPDHLWQASVACTVAVEPCVAVLQGQVHLFRDVTNPVGRTSTGRAPILRVPHTRVQPTY